MKLLLVITPMTLEERYGRLSSIGTLYPPLGLAYIASYAEMNGHEVRILDSEAEGFDYKQITIFAAKFKPDLVGIQTYCTNLSRAYKVAENLKKSLGKRVKIMLGGAQATLEPERTISNPYVDFVVYGEGEKVVSNLLSRMEIAEKNNKEISQKELNKINGLVYKTGSGKIMKNPREELIKNIDEIPMPARHLLPMSKYHSSANLRGKRTLNIMTSRGCPYRCAYCAGSLIFGKSHRFNSTERVIEELKVLKNKYGADSIQFFDETFTVNRKRVIELCDRMIKEKLNIEWSCFTRVNLVDKELLLKMRKAGCYLIFYGLESGVQRLLNIIQKDITLEQSIKAMKMTHEAGIETWVSFMLGLPTETKEDAEQTIRFALKVNPTFVQFPIATPFPGTRLYDIAKESGKIKEDWDNFMNWDEVAFVSKGRTEEDIKASVKKAYRVFYFRPGYILNRLKSILKLPLNKSFALLKAAILMVFT